MGKIGEWEDIAEKIAESLFFGAVMSFEKEELMRLIFPTENEEYNTEAEDFSEREKYAQESAEPTRIEDMFSEKREREIQITGAEYDAARVWEAEGGAARVWEAEGRAARVWEAAEIADRVWKAAEIADKVWETAEITAGLWEEEAEKSAIYYYYSDAGESSAAVRAGSALAVNEEESAAEHDLSEDGDFIENAAFNDLYAELFRKEAMIREYGVNEVQLPKMIYEAAEAEDAEAAFGSEAYEAYISEIYETEGMGRSGAKRIIESAAERGGGESREVRIEMVNNNNISSKADIDDVADMLTMRICDIMNRSADGIY